MAASGTLELQLYTTTKRVNSDESPSTYKYGLQVTLKEPTSVVHPVFIINRKLLNEQVKGALNTNLDVNYALCPDLGRYYWVNDIIAVSASLLEIHCTVDVLATYQKWIDSHELFVRYCSDKNVFSKNIDDDRLQPEYPAVNLEKQLLSDDQLKKYFGITGSSYSPDYDGCYILTCDSWFGNWSGVSTYVLNNTNFGILYKGLTSWLTTHGIVADDPLENVCDAIATNIMQNSYLQPPTAYIRNLVWVPFNYARYTESESNVYIAAYTMTDGNTTCKGKIISPVKVLDFQGNAQIPYNGCIPNPSANTIDPVFLRSSKYTQIKVKHPNGIIDINPDIFTTSSDSSINKITYYMCLGGATGEYSCVLYANSPITMLGAFSGNLGINLMGLIGAGGSQMDAYLGGTANIVKNLGKTLISAASDSSYKKLPVPEEGESVSNYNKSARKAISNNIDTAALRSAGALTAITSPLVSGTSFSPHSIGGSLPGGATGLRAATKRGAGDAVSTDFSNLFSIMAISSVPNLFRDSVVNSHTYTEYTKYCKQFGYPVFGYHKLSDLDAGFVQCSGPIGDTTYTWPSTRCHPTTEEINMITQHVNNGYYRTTKKG